MEKRDGGTKGRRHFNRDTTGVEKWGGVSPIRLGGLGERRKLLGERRKLPQWGPGQTPENLICRLFSVSKARCLCCYHVFLTRKRYSSKNGTYVYSVPSNVPPGRWTNRLKNGTSRRKRAGWQPYDACLYSKYIYCGSAYYKI